MMSVISLTPLNASAQESDGETQERCSCVPEEYAKACEEFRDLATYRGDAIEDLKNQLKACNLIRVDAQAQAREAIAREQKKSRQLEEELTRFPNRWQAFGAGMMMAGAIKCGSNLLDQDRRKSTVTDWITCGVTVTVGAAIIIQF